MSLSPSTAWLEAVTRSDAQIRFLVVITDGASIWKALSGSMASTSNLRLSTIPVAVQKVSPVGVELDPFTRETQMQELFVEVDDAWIRPKIVANRLKGQKLTVTMGAAELDEAEFVAFFEGPIEEFHPVDGHTVSMSVLDPFTVLQNNKIMGYWVNKHPLEALYDGAGGGVLEKGGVLSFDATSFDPSDAVYTGDISHFLVSRGGTYAEHHTLNEPTPAFEVASDLARLMNGHLIVDEAGAMKFVRFDGTAPALDTWTADDILPGSFRQESLDSNIINQIIMQFGRNREGRFQQAYQVDETDSQSDHKYPGTTERILGRKFSTDWIDTIGHMRESINDVVTSLRLFSGNLHGVSGNRSDGFGAPSGVRPVYLLLDSTHIPGIANAEIVKCTALSRGPDEMVVHFIDPVTGSIVDAGPFSSLLDFTTVARAQFGTNASRHSGPGSTEAYTIVHDVTIPAKLAGELLERFHDGCAIIELSTLLTKYKHQIGDMIAVTYSKYLAYNKNGLSAEKFEIIGKEMLENPPSIKWLLAAANTSAPTAVSKAGFASYGYGADQEAYSAVEQDELTQPFLANGLTGSQVAALQGRVAPGEARAADGSKGRVLANLDYEFTASRDTYVSIDTRTNQIYFRPVANLAAAPVLPAGEALIAKFVTDGAGITSVDASDTESLPLHGSKLVAESVDTPQLALQSVENAQIGLLAVDTPQLQALAVEAAKIGPSAVVDGKIATGGVSGSMQIAPAIVGTHQTVPQSIGRNHNPDFSMWTRG